MNRVRSFFSAAPKREAMEAYIALVSRSRKEFFYTDCAVPDTLDGRFEIILLHVFLALRDLKAQGQDGRCRLLLECLYDDMDRSLREMGVGDMGVGKRVKAMSKAAFGRLEAYTESFGDDEKMRGALLRNVYRGAKVATNAVNRLLAYVRNWASAAIENPESYQSYLKR